MPRKTRVCRACGKPIPPGRGTRKGYCGLNCSIPVALEAADQMRAKSGPHYQRWLAKMTQVHGHPPKDRG